jgi:cardiolipin synthase A/B
MGAIVQTIYDFVVLLWGRAFPHLEWLAVIFLVLLSWTTAVHALLNKRDSRAALGWIAVCLLFSPVGPLLYFLFGINRVRTQGQRLGGALSMLMRMGTAGVVRPDHPVVQSKVPETYRPIAGLSGRVTDLPLLSGNRIEPLENGEQAYPAMLEAIAQARQSIYLCTYIMDSNKSGRQFVAALQAAVRRGVDVRVIVDGVGDYYYFPRAGKLLQRAGIPTKRFLPPKLLPLSIYINLRNHRKIMVVDNRIGFTGGMNIGDRHLAGNLSNPLRVEDIHFRVYGPVIAQMAQVFLADWNFCGGNVQSSGPEMSSHLIGHNGNALCRTVVDGPNEDIDKLAMIFVGAAAAARKRIYIMTPYFLPAMDLVGALQAAALRGVEVAILLPSKSNLPYVKWASDNMLWMLLKKGVRIFYQPPPFVHSKIFMVDDYYTVIGSPNIDPRSLRLNFEMALEVYDPALNHSLAARFITARSNSREISLADMDGRALPIKIRDALCWLFSPYL